MVFLLCARSSPAYHLPDCPVPDPFAWIKNTVSAGAGTLIGASADEDDLPVNRYLTNNMAMFSVSGPGDEGHGRHGGTRLLLPCPATGSPWC